MISIIRSILGFILAVGGLFVAFTVFNIMQARTDAFLAYSGAATPVYSGARSQTVWGRHSCPTCLPWVILVSQSRACRMSSPRRGDVGGGRQARSGAGGQGRETLWTSLSGPGRGGPRPSFWLLLGAARSSVLDALFHISVIWRATRAQDLAQTALFN